MVHLLELLLCGGQGVWGGVEHVGLEALIRESDLEGLVIFLKTGYMCQVGLFTPAKK